MPRPSDWLLNVFFPILTGIFIYLLPQGLSSFLSIRHFLPDALWAWAYINCMQIIWNRKAPPGWVVACYLSAAGYEWGQNLGIFGGTGDWLDMLAYYLAFSAGLLANPFFRSGYGRNSLNPNHTQ